MKAQTIQFAAAIFTIMMMTSCDQEVIEPTYEPAEATSFEQSDSHLDWVKRDGIEKYSQSTSDIDARQSDDVKTSYGETDPRIHANSNMAAFDTDTDARESDDTQTKYSEADPRTHANTNMNTVDTDRDMPQSDVQKTRYDESPPKTSANTNSSTFIDVRDGSQSDKFAKGGK
jgi:hypothetical protein